MLTLAVNGHSLQALAPRLGSEAGSGEGGGGGEEVVVELTFCLNFQRCFIFSVDWSHVSSNHDTRKAQSIGLFQHPE